MAHGLSIWPREYDGGIFLQSKNSLGKWARDSRFAVKLPDSLDFPTAACLMCAGISIYGAIKRAEVKPGGSIAIVGIGGLGHIGTQVGKAMVCTLL